MLSGKRLKKGKLILLVALLGGGIALAFWLLMCPSEVEVTVGKFSTKEEGVRAAIQRLSSEIKRCPEAERYRIMWIGPVTPGYQGAIMQSFLYIRNSKALGYEHDAYSGISEEPYVVDDAAIRAVADKGGRLEDFLEYDQRPRK